MQDSETSGKKPIEEVQELHAHKARLERLRPESNGHKKPELPLATVGATGEKARRKTGIDILGEVPWGTHFCVFYQSKQDLIDILVPYFKEGLENNEFCMWITSEPLSAEDAEKSLSQAVTNLDDYIKKGRIEILDYSDWYTKSGAFEADSALQGCLQKHDQAIKNGFDGLRLTGNTLWLEKKDWVKFADYEAVVNSVIGKYRMLATCTYCLDKCGASEILDVEHNHQFSLIKWQGDWKILESCSHNQLEARLAKQTAVAKAFERSKRDWVKTFNAISDWVVMTDLKGRILRTNRAGENFTGKTLDEIIGQSCCKLVHGQDKHIPGCPLQTMLHTRQQATMELNVPNTDRWLMVTVDPVVDGKGNLIGAVHITRDITQRKKDEKALRESEEKYRDLFENAREAIITIDLQGKITGANKLVEEYGFRRKELIGKKLFDFVPEYDRARAFSDFETLIRGNPVKGEMDVITPNGIRTVEYRDNPIERGGEIIGVQAILTDITERKKAEKMLQDSEEKWHSLAENAPNMIMIVNRDGTIQFINRTPPGISIEEAIGRNIYDYIKSEYQNVARENIKQVFRTGRPASYESMAPGPYGRDSWYDTQVGAIKHNGQVVAVTLFATDITERKKAAEALRKSEEHYRMLTETMNDGLGQMDEKGVLVYVNKKLGEILGYPRDEMIGSHWAQFFGPDAQETIKSHLVARRKGLAGDYEAVNTRKDGRKMYLRLSPQGVFDEQGKFKGNFAIITDITEHKRVAEEIENLAKFPSENPNPVLRIAEDGTILYANSASSPVLETWGCREGQRLPDDCYKRLEQAVDSGKAYSFEFNCHNGRIFLVALAPVAGAHYVNAYGLDITERKRSEEALRQSERQASAAIEAARGFTFNYDIATGKINWGGAIEEITGYTPEEFAEVDVDGWAEMIHPDDRDRVLSILQEAIQVKDRATAEYRFRTKRGDYVILSSISLTEKMDGKAVHLVGILQDITERKKAEKAFLEYQAKLKSLASELTLAEERERRRIADGIHDDIGTKLALAKFELQSLMEGAAETAIAASLNSVCAEIDKAIEDAHSLTFELSNPVLYEVGLDAAVESWLGQHIGKKSRLRYEVASEPRPIKPDMEISVVLFGVIRELLTNVIKHADASMVQVHLKKDDKTIRVSIEDDGVGFELSEPGLPIKENGGFGLFNTREKVEYLGGRIKIESKPGRGCKVTMIAPLKQ